jgi:hypothetical protein
MRRDEPTDHVGSTSGSLSRRHVLEAAGAGAVGVASVVWSLGDRTGQVAGEPERDAAPSNTSTSAPSVASVSASRWLDIHRANGAEAFADPETQFRTYQDDLEDPMTRSPTATQTSSPTATPTGPTTTHTLLFEGTGLEMPKYVIEGPEPGPTGIVVGGMHGDELSGYRAAGIVAEWGIERGTLVVLPAANPPAIERGVRDGRNGDLNRKFPSSEEPPTTRLAAGLWAVVLDHDPDWLADLHSSHGIWDSEEGGVGQAVFPTPVGPAQSYAETTVEAVNEAYDLEDELSYHVGNLLDGDRPMLAHRVGAVLDIPAFILETTEVAELDRQIDWHLYATEVLVRLFDQVPRR